MADILQKLLPVLLPLLLGLAVAPVMQMLKRASTWLDMQSPVVKRVVVALLSVGATFLAKATNLPIPEDVLSMNGEVVTALLTALAAFLTHKLVKKPEA